MLPTDDPAYRMLLDSLDRDFFLKRKAAMEGGK
jgi:hypothetical protein